MAGTSARTPPRHKLRHQQGHGWETGAPAGTPAGAKPGAGGVARCRSGAPHHARHELGTRLPRVAADPKDPSRRFDRACATLARLLFMPGIVNKARWHCRGLEEFETSRVLPSAGEALPVSPAVARLNSLACDLCGARFSATLTLGPRMRPMSSQHRAKFSRTSSGFGRPMAGHHLETANRMGTRTLNPADMNSGPVCPCLRAD